MGSIDLVTTIGPIIRTAPQAVNDEQGESSGPRVSIKLGFQGAGEQASFTTDFNLLCHTARDVTKELLSATESPFSPDNRDMLQENISSVMLDVVEHFDVMYGNELSMLEIVFDIVSMPIQDEAEQLCPFFRSESEAECPVCMESLELAGKEIAELPCFHCFHRGCIIHWSMQSLDAESSCPICRNAYSSLRCYNLFSTE